MLTLREASASFRVVGVATASGPAGSGRRASAAGAGGVVCMIRAVKDQVATYQVQAPPRLLETSPNHKTAPDSLLRPDASSRSDPPVTHRARSSSKAHNGPKGALPARQDGPALSDMWWGGKSNRARSWSRSRNSSRPFMSRVMDAGSAWLTLSM